MSVKVMQGELLRSIDNYLANVDTLGWKVGLFVNDYTPVSGSVLANFTPPTAGGYTSLKNLTAFGSATWVSPRAVAVAADLTWTGTGVGADNVYGYYVIDAANVVVWADRNVTGPLGVGAVGQRYVVTPTFTRRSEF